MIMKSILRDILLYFRGIKKVCKSFYCYRPISVVKEKSSKININGLLYFNVPLNPKQKRKTAGYIELNENSKLFCNGDFTFYTGCKLSVMNNAELKLGSGYCNCNSKIYCYESIIIGNNVIIAEDVNIRDSDNHLISGNSKKSAPIVIGDNVRIGANAVVLKDIPDNSTAVGIPARIIHNS